jgi:signal peptidase II
MVMEFIIIILGIIMDRISKLWAVKRLAKGDDIVIIKDFFRFTYEENTGAAFSFLSGKVIFLSIITSVVVLFMIYYLYKNRKENLLFKVSMSLIISGAIGNLIDRVYYKYVIDFIMCHYKDVYVFPIFNVADMMVVVGTCLLALYIIKDVKE